MSNIVGYARVSKREQNPAAQEAELRAAGAARVFVDHGESSRVADRPQWLACLDYLREGDTLVVRRLDRIAGSETMVVKPSGSCTIVRSTSEYGPARYRHDHADGSCAVQHRCHVRAAPRQHDFEDHRAWTRARTRPGPRRWSPV